MRIVRQGIRDMPERQIQSCITALCLIGLILAPLGASAVDSPHNTNDTQCAQCHIAHNGGTLLLVTNGLANFCLTCHTAGGAASGKAFASSDQAWPWPGLTSGTSATGTSHRWDSSPAGHAIFMGGALTPSTGGLLPGGVYTGYYPKTYTITISNAGNVGVATFNWSATVPGGGAGANVTTSSSASNTLDSGIYITFTNGAGTSFQANDQWLIPVRPDLRQPTNSILRPYIINGMMSCATCHDAHKQRKTPFDPNAPTNTTSAGRHFMRIDNDADQMCLDCHAARNVTNSIFGSHPVGITTISNSLYKLPGALPLEKAGNHLGCMTCHDTHYNPGNNGMLLRMTNTLALCMDCHQLANTNTPAAHFVSTNSATLWPGGQYGSLLTNRADTTLSGSCLNCHMVHGWPNTANPTNDYHGLLSDQEENLCFTCHDGNGPAIKNVYTAFTNKSHHPVLASEQMTGRTVECLDCHNPHQSLANGHVYTNTATTNRNLVSNPLKGVAAAAVNYASMTNFSSITADLYTAIPQATNEYQICLKCHSGYGYPKYSAGTAAFTSNSAAVGGSGTQWSSNLLGQVIFRANDPTTYTVTNVTSATNLTVMPAYSRASASGQSYTIMNLPPCLTPVYTNGTASFTNGSMTVRGTGTAWDSGMTGLWIAPTSTPTIVYRVTTVLNTTNLTIYPAYAGTSVAGIRYQLTGGTDLAQEFSRMNRSGHPVMTGLSNYVNSLSPKALSTSIMKAPWNVNVGNQTMMCSDCHDTTSTNYVASAAQGPHGSAVQYILRGPNGNNWPNVLLSDFNSSWCANCHSNQTGDEHVKDKHLGQRCYACHIVVPHGGKVSRLIGDRDTMPPRYAWNNVLTNTQVQSFSKNTPNNYSEANCQAACDSKHSAAASENW